MTTLFPARGCLVIVGGSKAGSFRLDPPLQTNRSRSPVLIQGANMTFTEAFSKTQTLDGKRILYSFGSQHGEMTIRLTLLMGQVDDTGGTQQAAWADVLNYYEAHKLSGSDEPITVSQPANIAKKVFLVGCSLSAPDPEFNTAEAVFSAVIVEPPQS